MNVTVLAGGVGAARLLRGLVTAVDPGSVTAVVNVADDDVIHGLHVSPDLDTITYTCAGEIDAERGWGLAGESWHAMESLRRYSGSAGRSDIGWFNLGDRDLGTHMYRTSRRHEGAPLSTITAEIASAWNLGFTMIPVSDDPIATRIATADLGELSFQEYFVREHHDVAATAVRFVGVDDARPAPGVIEAIEQADVVIVAPSNPIVSIGPVLAVPGVRRALAARRGATVAISPLIGGKALKGPADRLMVELGHDASVEGIARIYADVAATLVIDDIDAGSTDAVEAAGIRCVVTDTIMTDVAAAARLALTVMGAT